jgi:hypothetical protein
MTLATSAPAEQVDLLLFEIGDQVFGTDASTVLRIDRPGPNARVLTDLGLLRFGSRALVFNSPQGEAQLTVDAIRPVERARVASLRRVPLAGAICPYAVGFWLDGDVPIVLVDLNRAIDQGR